MVGNYETRDSLIIITYTYKAAEVFGGFRLLNEPCFLEFKRKDFLDKNFQFSLFCFDWNEKSKFKNVLLWKTNLKGIV